MIDKRSYDTKKQNDFLKMPAGSDLTNLISQFGSILNLFGGRSHSQNQGQRNGGGYQNYNNGYNNRPKQPFQQRKTNSANPTGMNNQNSNHYYQAARMPGPMPLPPMMQAGIV